MQTITRLNITAIALAITFLFLSALPVIAQDSFTEPITGMEFVRVPGGCFEIGCGSWASDCFYDEKPAREVCLDEFWMGKYEVTQGQWKAIMGNNPSHFQKGDSYPVENVSWDDAQEYIEKLNNQDANYAFRLPTEAEWEYACRSGGKNQKFCGGENLEDLAWFISNSNNTTHPVGFKKPNGLWLYDMSGNVREWSSDSYRTDAYQSYVKNNPSNYKNLASNVVRGGSFTDSNQRLRSLFRQSFLHNQNNYSIGFRLVRNKTIYSLEHATNIYKKGMYSDSISIFFHYAQQNNPLALYYLGTMNIEAQGTEKNIPKGIEYFQKAAELGHLEAQQKLREFIPMFLLQAEMKFKAGDTDGALAAIATVLDLEAESIPALALLGRIQLENGRYSEAETAFSSALKLLHGVCDQEQALCGEVMTQLALAQMGLGEREKALGTLRSLRDELPGVAQEVHSLECWLLLSNWEYPDALACFTQYHEDGAEKSLASLGMAHAHFMLKDYSRVDEAMQTVTPEGLRTEADSRIVAYCPQCLAPAMETAALLGVSLEVGPVNNQEQLAHAQSYAVGYLKSPTFLMIDGEQQMVFSDEGLLFDPQSDEVRYPYPGISLAPDSLAAGNSVEALGKYEVVGNTVVFTLRLLADFAPERILLDGAELSLAAMTVGGVVFQPKLRREYTLAFRIPKTRSQRPMRLNILVKDGRTHDFTFAFDGTQVRVERRGSELVP